MFGITITERCHRLLAPCIQPGDTAVDATLGRGNDAVFLASAVGHTGTLYGFDIQEEALTLTEKKLSGNAATCHLHLILDSHHKMDAYVKEPPAVIMFNLGYLPGGSKEITTAHATSVAAIQTGLNLLKEGGIMSVITYKGHPGALEEHQMVMDLLSDLPSDIYEVLSFLQRNRSDTTPELHLIQKISSS